MTARAFVLALVPSMVLAASAKAQDLAGPPDAAPVVSPAVVAPVISAVVVNGVPGRRANPGGVVHLVGQGFLAFEPGAPPSDLVVEVDGQLALVVEGSPEHLGFYVPHDASVLGLARIRVTRPDGARVETTLHLVTQGLTGCLPNGLVLTSLLVNGQRARGVAPGDTLELGGRGWPSDREDGVHPPGLSVSLSERGLLLVEARPDRLVVQVPEETPIGPSTLEVWVQRDGDLHAVELPLEVVDPTWGAAPPPPAPPAAPPPPAPGAAQLGVTSCGPLQDAADARVEVKGTAPPELPDGFTVDVELRRGGQAVESRRTEIRGGAWSARMDAIAQPGRYEVIVVFELWKQPRILAKEFVSKLPHARRDDFARLERRETFSVERR